MVNKKMKILITHELFMPDFSGGGEKLVYEMAKGLVKAGNEVKVLTTGNPNIKDFEGIKTIRLKRNRFLMNLAFYSIYKHAKWADIIQTSTYNACFPSWVVSKILKKPIFCMVMSYWGSQWKNMRPGIKGTVSKYMEKLFLHRSYNKLIFLSEFSKNFILKEGFKTKNYFINNPGVDTHLYKPLNKENYVLFSGRYAKQKGVYDLLEVAKRLPSINFILMGWGKEEKKMKKLASSNVIFKNKSLKDGDSFFKEYGKSPLFFLPSYGETFGFVLVEAMAAGCCVISTMPLGYKGAVVKIGNINEMVNSIKDLFNNKEKMLKYGQENIELAKKFTWENFTKKLIEEYKRCYKK